MPHHEPRKLKTGHYRNVSTVDIIFPRGQGVFSRRMRRSVSNYVRRSVTDDWIRGLPHDKRQIFDSIVHRWECSFAMMSVALDDALSMRARGQIVCARQQVSVSAVLLSRLSDSLVAFCELIASRGRYIRQVPPVEPLNVEFFRGNTAQSAATWNGILHFVVFGERSRFVHKLKILAETVTQLEREFDKAARDIAAETVVPPKCWATLDHLHYDFTTCLREAEVVFKSFLRALPTEQLAALAGEIENPGAKRVKVRAGLGLSGASA